MLSGDPLGNIIRSLPRPILFGILTSYALGHVAGVTLPPLESLSEEEFGSIVSTVTKIFRAGIAIMPTPGGLLVFGVYLFKDFRGASRAQSP